MRTESGVPMTSCHYVRICMMLAVKSMKKARDSLCVEFWSVLIYIRTGLQFGTRNVSMHVQKRSFLALILRQPQFEECHFHEF